MALLGEYSSSDCGGCEPMEKKGKKSLSYGGVSARKWR